RLSRRPLSALTPRADVGARRAPCGRPAGGGASRRRACHDRAMALDDLRIVALAPARADDYLRFFDDARRAGPADAPAWAACYCHRPHVPPPLDPATFDGDANRLA